MTSQPCSPKKSYARDRPKTYNKVNDEQAKKILRFLLEHRLDFGLGRSLTTEISHQIRAHRQSQLLNLAKENGLEYSTWRALDTMIKTLERKARAKLAHNRCTGVKPKELTEVDNLVLDAVGRDDPAITPLKCKDSGMAGILKAAPAAAGKSKSTPPRSQAPLEDSDCSDVESTTAVPDHVRSLLDLRNNLTGSSRAELSIAGPSDNGSFVAAEPSMANMIKEHEMRVRNRTTRMRKRPRQEDKPDTQQELMELKRQLLLEQINSEQAYQRNMNAQARYFEWLHATKAAKKLPAQDDTNGSSESDQEVILQPRIRESEDLF